MLLIFLVISVPKGYNVQMSLSLTLTGDAMSPNGLATRLCGDLSVYSTPPPGKLPSAVQLKSLLGDSCS